MAGCLWLRQVSPTCSSSKRPTPHSPSLLTLPARPLHCPTSIQGASQHLLVLGDATGAVTCVDAERRSLAWGPVAAVDSPLAAVSVGGGSSGAPVVLAVGTRGSAALLDLGSGRVVGRFQALKSGARQATVLGGSNGAMGAARALVAGASLALLDLAAGGQRLRKWAGHAAEVVAMAVTPDGAYAATLGSGERQVRPAIPWCSHALAATPGTRCRPVSAHSLPELCEPPCI